MVTSTFSYYPSLAGVGTTITVPQGDSVLLSNSLVGSILNSYDFITNAKLKIQVPFNTLIEQTYKLCLFYYDSIIESFFDYED